MSAARAVLALVATLTLSACGGESSSAPPPPVERIARELADAGATSAIVYVAEGDDEHEAAAGSDSPETDQRFRVGSVTKTFTAAIVLQLVDEGRLRLTDTLAQHLPEAGVDKRITIRQLLQHRSGLANITDFPEWLERANRSRTHQPADTLRFGLSRGLTFDPGTQFAYSNTNFIALGLVIEAVTGGSYGSQLKMRLLEPLGLDRTELPETRRVEDLDDEGDNPNLAWAAGAIVSDTRDLRKFFSELLSGDVLSEESLAEMLTVDPSGFAAGLGIFSTKLACGRFWGHDGGILDYGTLVRAGDDGGRIAVVSVRGALIGEPPDEEALLCPGVGS
jgi:D-alanyl-D-alanine carboxypeptidase